MSNSFFSDVSKSSFFLSYAPTIAMGTQVSYALVSTASLATVNPVTMVACGSIALIKGLYDVYHSANRSNEISYQFEKISEGLILGATFGAVFGVLHRIAHFFYKMYLEKCFIHDSKIQHATSLTLEAIKGSDLPAPEYIELDDKNGYFTALWESAHVGLRNFPKILNGIQVYVQKIVRYENRSRWVNEFDLNRFVDGERSSRSVYVTEMVPIYASCVGFKMPFTGWKLPESFPDFKISNLSIVPLIAGLFTGYALTETELD